MNNAAFINQRTFLFALMFAVTAIVMAAVAGGLDSVALGAHDTFHELRHGLGISCH